MSRGSSVLDLKGLAGALGSRFGGSAASRVCLATVSNWRIGGVADVFYRPASGEGAAEAVGWLRARGIPVTVVGMTTNLLFADAGVRGVILQIADNMGGVMVENETLRVEAGAWMPGVAFAAMRHGLTGIEHTCGIPGTIGGLIGMNGGSLRKSISASLVEVSVVAADGQRLTIPKEECGFAYRRSRFQGSSDLIVGCVLRLQPERHPGDVRTTMRGILRSRRRFPRKEPNCGSVFVSHPDLYASIGAPGKLIEELGLKNFRIGGAMVSPHHANFIVNTGDATADDVLMLIGHIRRLVHDRWGYLLEVEARYVSEDGVQRPADGLPLTNGPSR